MKYNANYLKVKTSQQQRSCAHAVLDIYAQFRGNLTPQDSAVVIEAHQVLFPHSSSTGLERVVSLAQRLLPEEQVEFHNINEHYPHVKSEAIRSLMGHEQGYAALLLAGTLEHAANEFVNQAHQYLRERL